MNLADLPGRLARAFVHALVRTYYPRIEVTGADRIPAEDPVLLCANHANSLMDPPILGIAARRPVRLLAKAPLFETPVLGAIIRALGMIPAYRGSDDASRASVVKNLESLAVAARQLAAGHAIGIFPEGKSHDVLQLQQVKTGAARLALQAVALGAKDLRLVPVGINYEFKERFRSSVWVNVGEPIAVAAWAPADAADEKRAMRELTAELDRRLKACVIHLEEPAWEPLLPELDGLLWNPAVRRGSPTAAIHQRQVIASAMNHFLACDRPRAEGTATRFFAWLKDVRAAGLVTSAPLLRLRGWRFAGVTLCNALWYFLGLPVALAGFVHHIVPHSLARLIAGRVATAGRMTLAFYRLLAGLPLHTAWYAAVWWGMSRYFLPWVAWTWAVLMPAAGLFAIRYARRARRQLPVWWAQLRLLCNRERLASLRAGQRELLAVLDELARDYLAAHPPVPPPETGKPKMYRPSPAFTAGLTALILTLAVLGGERLLRDEPIEFLDRRGPDLTAVPAKELRTRLESDERGLLAVIDGLADLETRFREFEAGLLRGDRSYYRTEDEQAIQRMLLAYVNYRAALARLAWKYQRGADLADEILRLRVILLQYAAAAGLYDITARFVAAFQQADIAPRKLNEGDVAAGIPPGLYNGLRRELANRTYLEWLQASLHHYESLQPAFAAHGLDEPPVHARLHAVIAAAAQTPNPLDGSIWLHKAALASEEALAAANHARYHSGRVVSTIIGDTKLRAPRGGKSLIAPEQVEELRTKLRPGDVILERRNWFLSNAFLPGYWPHSALYVGTADDLRSLGLDRDPRVARHLEAFARPGHAGHRPVIIEAVSEGVVFTSLEHSIGEADSAAVLRPRLDDDARREAIARAFSHAGKPYDFDFDFFSADKLVCTEVVHRSLSGYVDFPLVEILGTKTLPALEIVRYFTTDAGRAKLEFVAFLDGDERRGNCRFADEASLIGTLERPALTWLQGLAGYR